MNRWKLISALLLFTTLISSFLAFNFSRADEVDEFSAAAADSLVKELPYVFDDLIVSFESYHQEPSEDTEAQIKNALLTKSLQRLTGNQRLLSTAERSSLLEKGWFNDYTHTLFTLHGIITDHSFEQKTEENSPAFTEALRMLKEEVETIVNDPAFSIEDRSKLDELTTTIQQFNENHR
ncbi:hypothetical protein [Halobacillus litoralis]|uniref:hypothetical protein n=1 Tax=Halobacillus litoralis TaxID=45668 RepID=UPI001CD5E808|nr:hypothetical protein [Halobacillus litoralis]MCA1023517.1 hypothetical protein [Halobacillus litoralis]